jgi:predicted oxidoreductase (fatty acid repression mutant protein)
MNEQELKDAIATLRSKAWSMVKNAIKLSPNSGYTTMKEILVLMEEQDRKITKFIDDNEPK